MPVWGWTGFLGPSNDAGVIAGVNFKIHPVLFTLMTTPIDYLYLGFAFIFVGLGAGMMLKSPGRLFAQPWTRLKHAPMTTLLALAMGTPLALGLLLVAAGIIFLVFLEPNVSLGDVQTWLVMGITFLVSLIGGIFFDSRRPKPQVAPLPLAPRLHTGDPEFDAAFAAVYELLELNLMPPVDRVSTRWASPGPKYPGAYLWDSAFISLVWKLWDPRVANEILQPFFEFQVKTPKIGGGPPDVAEHGRVPQQIFMGHTITSISNPPLLAWALNEIYPYARDKALLSRAIEDLSLYQQWLLHNRSRNDLFVWAHSYESGLDNSPRFTDASEALKEDVEDLAVVDLASFMVLQARSLAHLAELAGLQEEHALQEKTAEDISTAVRDKLWAPEVGLFLDYRFSTKDHPHVNTIASFFPLIAGIPTPEQRIRLLEQLQDPAKYNTLIPFPTVARDDSQFMKDTWRGPPWINTAYLCLLGMMAPPGTPQPAVIQQAADMAFRLVEGVYKTYQNCGSFYEFYDPDRYDLEELTRKKGNLMKQITLGGKPVKKFVGWTGLVNTILVEMVIGYTRTPNGEVMLVPHLPERWVDVPVTLELPYFHETLTVTLARDGQVEYQYEQSEKGARTTGTVLNHQESAVLFSED